MYRWTLTATDQEVDSPPLAEGTDADIYRAIITGNEAATAAVEAALYPVTDTAGTFTTANDQTVGYWADRTFSDGVVLSLAVVADEA